MRGIDLCRDTLRRSQAFGLRQSFRHLVLASLLGAVGFGAEFPANQQPPAIPKEVEDYSRGLEVIRKGAANLSLEKLLALGRKAADALVIPKIPGGSNLLEGLIDKDFQAVVHKMEGFWVNRQEAEYVEPNPSFFLELAKAYGDRGSVEFFAIYTKTSDHARRIYIQQQTDYSGCIRFGSMSLIDCYARWSTYRAKYPNRYSSEVLTFIRDVEDSLTEGTCACGGNEEALREFGAFVRAFPRSTISKRVSERIDQIKQGKSDIRWRCISG